MSWGGDGMNAWRYPIFACLNSPLFRFPQLIRKYAAVKSRARRNQFIPLNMYFATRQIPEAAHMVEMQVSDEYHIDIGGCEP
jgi:hypothetical protein